MPDTDYHGWTHRPSLHGGADPLPPIGHYELKVTADANALDGLLPDTVTKVFTGDAKFVIVIPEDLHGAKLVHAAAGVSTAGSVTIQIRNVTTGADMLSTRITIDSGEYSSYTAATPPVVNAANAEVSEGDRIAVDVDASGGTAKGLCVILRIAHG